MKKLLSPNVYFVLAIICGLGGLLAGMEAHNVGDATVGVVLGAMSAGLFVGAAVLVND